MANVFTHDGIVRCYVLAASLTFEPRFVRDDLFDYRQLADNDWVWVIHDVAAWTEPK